MGKILLVEIGEVFLGIGVLESHVLRVIATKIQGERYLWCRYVLCRKSPRHI